MNKEGKKKDKRRPRNDPQNRNFICGCGKSYLSYPALYTHQKMKHGKEKPVGTKTPVINGISRRGRPTKPKDEPDLKSDEKKSQNSSFSDSDCSDDALDEFLYFFTCFAKKLKNEELKNQANNNNKQNIFRPERNFSFLMDISDDNYNVADNFPKEYFQTSEDYINIYNKIDLFEKNPEIMESILDIEKDGPKNAKIDEIFATFLINISKHLKVEYYKEMALFTCIYQKALFELAQKKNPDFSIEQKDSLNAEFIIDNSNEFILEVLPQLLPKLKLDQVTEKLFFLGGDQKINCMILLTQHFGNWLYACHFTDSKLEINYSDLV